jgi:hypothetical protein
MSVRPKKEWDSTRLIGTVNERYDQIKDQGISRTLKGEPYDWNSFYTGWIEGRVDMLSEIHKEENEKYDW